MINQVLQGGEGTWSEDKLIPIFRNNKLEDVYWTLSFSAVYSNERKPAGVFVTWIETTQKVLSLAKIEEKIVDNHNGVIIATGELNKGAAF